MQIFPKIFLKFSLLSPTSVIFATDNILLLSVGLCKKRIDSLIVKYHQQTVGALSLEIDGKCCTFEYDRQWLAVGFSISPLELPLKPGLFFAKPTPFHGNFGIFEDSLPDGYKEMVATKKFIDMLTSGPGDVRNDMFLPATSSKEVAAYGTNKVYHF